MSCKIFSRQTYKYLLMVMMFFTIFYSICMPVYASDQKVVRVGIIDFKGYYETGNDGVHYGYGHEFLSEIAKYTGFQYEFVYGNWSELLVMLEKGEIDLLDNVQLTEERSKIYNFAVFPTITLYEVLFTRIDNDRIKYNDFQSFSGCKVGLLKGNVNNEKFFELMRKNNVVTENIEFDSIAEFNEALKNGAIDLASMHSIMEKTDVKEVARFAPTTFYFVTPKNDVRLIKEINDALEYIHTNKIYFKTKLYEKYYGDRKVKINLTKEEQDLINETPSLSMVYDPAWAPMEYYDEKNQSASGINPQIIKLIAEYSGLNFELIHADNYEKAIELVSSGQVDLMMSFEGNRLKAGNSGLLITDDFVAPNFALIGIDKNITDDKIIALSKEYLSAEKYIRKIFPNNKIVIYTNVYDTYLAISLGEADYTLENIGVAAHTLKSYGYHDLSIVYMTSLKYPIAIATRNDINPMFIEIINKAIASITPDQIESIVYSYSLQHSVNDLTVNKIIKQYRTEVIFSVFLMGFGIICFAAYLIVMQGKNEKKLWNIAYIDELTNISNQKKFKIDAKKLLSGSKREDYEFIRFDIKNFKMINDMFSVEEGDKVLLNVVKVIKTIILPGELFARIASDNFILLVKHNNNTDIYTNPKKILVNFVNFQKEQKKLYTIDFAIGVYRIKKTDDDINSMLDNLNMAHKLAKNRENNTIVFYNDEIRDKALKAKDIENRMITALENDEFKVFLQPKYSLFRENMVGAEALVRWQTDSGDTIYPNDFIPLFESNGFILKLDMYMLDKVCALLKKWIDAGFEPISISVNFSRNHLKKENFVQEILAVIEKYDIATSLIEVELTENSMLGNENLLQEILRQLHDAGLRLAIDDFGTGYSSLGLLKDIPIDVIKLDKSFFDRCADDIRGQTVIASIIEMSKELEIKIVAEGVESRKNIDFLRNIGYEIMVQGYYFAKPMDIAAFEETVKYSKQA